jgi:hypothetical protein
VLNKIYWGLGGSIVMGYALFSFFGRELGDEKREVVPAEVRNSPGGYRSSHIWVMGFRGGK